MQTVETSQSPRSEGTPKVQAVDVVAEYLAPSTREDQVAAFVFFELGATGGSQSQAIRDILWERARPYAEGIGWEKQVGQQDDLEAVVSIHKLLAIWRQQARARSASRLAIEHGRGNEDRTETPRSEPPPCIDASLPGDATLLTVKRWLSQRTYAEKLTYVVGNELLRHERDFEGGDKEIGNELLSAWRQEVVEASADPAYLEGAPRDEVAVTCQAAILLNTDA